ncbi:hypothetical protein ACVWZA_000424 [Sphingomonas sp. UYAg733]
MHRLLSLIASITAAALLAGCSILNGPGAADIEKIARQQMLDNLGPDAGDPAAKKALEAAVAGATISKSGLCNNSTPDRQACAVNVSITMPGATEATMQTFVVELAKGADGTWKGV